MCAYVCQGLHVCMCVHLDFHASMCASWGFNAYMYVSLGLHGCICANWGIHAYMCELGSPSTHVCQLRSPCVHVCDLGCSVMQSLHSSSLCYLFGSTPAFSFFENFFTTLGNAQGFIPGSMHKDHHWWCLGYQIEGSDRTPGNCLQNRHPPHYTIAPIPHQLFKTSWQLTVWTNCYFLIIPCGGTQGIFLVLYRIFCLHVLVLERKSQCLPSFKFRIIAHPLLPASPASGSPHITSSQT